MRYPIQPTISVVLCTFNRAAHLPTCIDSVLAQTCSDFELIVVDDGSTDDTFAVVDRYLMRHPHVRYCKHANRRQGYARNTGIQASLGRYITFIDSDDSYLPTHLEARLAYMEAHADIDLISGGLALDEEIHVVDYFHRDRTINLRECVVGPTFFGRRPLFFELDGFSDDPHFDDTDFWHRAAARYKTALITEPETYRYTRAPSSITRDLLQSQGACGGACD